MSGADVTYVERVDWGEDPQSLLARLTAEIPWRQESIVLWGRRVLQPRLISWHGDPGARYRYSGLSLEPSPWTPGLAAIRERIESRLGTRFNSVLANLYRDQRDSMGLHSDDEPELGLRPLIASVSFGAERGFVFRPRRPLEAAPVRLRLASGSLLVMGGDTQRCWRHALPKQTRACGPRVNLTFRRIVSDGRP